MNTTVKLNNGLEMPIVGLGTWQSPREKVMDAMRAALNAGYRHIDTAYNYKNEDAIGEVLNEYINVGKVKREDLFITTKLPMIHMDPSNVRRSLESSLKRLNLSYVDLYLIHAPVALKLISDDNTFPVDEHGKFIYADSCDHVATWKAMEELVHAGLTKSIGVSNFNSEQVDKICQIARVQPVTNQVECNLYFPNLELLEFCKKKNVTLTAYAPIGSPGRPAQFIKENSPVLIEEAVVMEVAKKYKKTPAQVLLRNLMQRGIIVIPKSVTPERIRQNIQVFDFNISEEDMQILSKIQTQPRMFDIYFWSDHQYFPFKIPY